MKDTRRLKRTLSFAGVFALLAMIYVPAPAPRPGWAAHYRFIFSQHETGIAFFQLLVNVVFAAIVGALAANLSRRVVLRAARIVVVMAIILAASLGFIAFQHQMKTGAEREEGFGYGAMLNGNFNIAKEHLLKASNYWWWKGWWDGAREAREHAADEGWMKKEFQDACVLAAQSNENRAHELFRFASSLNRYPRDEEVAEAKRLLLTAAEKWDTVGNAAEAERVRAWELRIKTEAEFRASLPDQPANKYVSTDPNASLREAESRREWEAEEAQCREPFPYPPHKWTHVTQFGKTFAIIKFRERKEGDRKKNWMDTPKLSVRSPTRNGAAPGKAARIGSRLCFTNHNQAIDIASGSVGHVVRDDLGRV